MTPTPAIAAGTLPQAIQNARPLCTVPARRCWMPPNVFVTAA